MSQKEQEKEKEKAGALDKKNDPNMFLYSFAMIYALMALCVVIFPWAVSGWFSFGGALLMTFLGLIQLILVFFLLFYLLKIRKKGQPLLF